MDTRITALKFRCADAICPYSQLFERGERGDNQSLSESEREREERGETARVRVRVRVRV
jgi:hypothetical protein